MRFLFMLGAGIVLFLGTSSVPAQKAKDQEKKPIIDTQIQDIGGKTLEQWIKEIPSLDRSRGENAIRTVLAFGPDRAFEAVHVLVAELKRQTHGNARLDVSITVNAAIALGEILGGAEKPDPDVVNDAVKVLVILLRDPQAIVRYRSAEALGKIGRRAKPAIGPLLSLLRDKAYPSSWESRQAAATALGFIALDRDGKTGPSAEVVKGLYQALSDTSFQVRLAAIRSMTFVGTPANTSEKDRDAFLGYLKKATLEKEDPTVRVWAHMAIMSISHSMDIGDVKAICGMLKHREMAGRVQAAQALAICGASAFADDAQIKERNVLKSSIQPLIRSLDDKEPMVALNCIIALTKMGKEGKKAIPALREISRDMKRPEGLRQAAIQAADFLSGTTVQAPKENPKGNGIGK
jgi:HEAT repeat protein